MSRPFVVVISGGTASGKTTLARQIRDRTGALIITHDRYYYGATNPVHFNFDHPDALETGLMVEHLRALMAGQAVDLPIYDFATHSRAQGTDRALPGDLVVVEGILTFQNEALRDIADLLAFVHAPADIRLVRRLRRDVVERGRSTDGVLRQYMETVRPSHEEFVEPCASYADLVLNGTVPVDDLADDLLRAIKARGWQPSTS